MTQSQLNRAVASATGESLLEIRRRGFGPADRADIDTEWEYDPPRTVDWDELDARRVVLFP